MAKKLTNVETYLIILFLFGLLVTGVLYMADEIRINDNSNIDNDSIEYIANLQGLNLSDYTATRKELEKSSVISANGSQGNPKDEALDYLQAKQSGFKIETIIKGVFNIPGFLINKMLRLDLSDWNWIIDIFNWTIWLLITLAATYYIRGLIDKG